MLNPEFATPGFIPDPTTTYRCSAVTNDTGFTFLHALVLGGPSRLREFYDWRIFHPAAFQRLALIPTTTGWTPLMLAALHGSKEIVRLLIPVSNLQAQNGKGLTPLMLAALDGDGATVRMLLPGSDLTLTSIMRNNFVDILAYHNPKLLCESDLRGYLSLLSPGVLILLCKDQKIEALTLLYPHLPAELFLSCFQRYPKVFLKLLTQAIHKKDKLD